MVIGEQEPRVSSIPDYDWTHGDAAVELAERAGLVLDPWQQFVLKHSLGVRPDGRWAAFEVGLDVSRQNGKGSILEALELYGLFELHERLIIHSAHQFDTSLEAFRRLMWLIEDSPDLEKRVKRTSRSHGEEGIELTDGCRIRFRTRTKGGGRGFTCDRLIIDEAMYLQEAAHGALLPTLSARPNPQVWYTGSAVDQLVHADGVVFARIRERGHRGDDPSLAYFEWSADGSSPEEMDDEALSDLAAWAQANPGLGIRITAEHVGHELRSMDRRTFAVERLGVGDWPRTDGLADTVISPEQWAALTDVNSKLVGPLWLAVDVTPSRDRATIGVAGSRPDKKHHLEVIDRRQGTGWVADRVKKLTFSHKIAGVVMDGVGPAASLIREIEEQGVQVTQINSQDHAQACGLIYDLVDQQELRHLGQPELTTAIKGAQKRPLGDAWAWSRKNSQVDISPLVACTLALWGAAEKPAEVFAFAW